MDHGHTPRNAAAAAFLAEMLADAAAESDSSRARRAHRDAAISAQSDRANRLNRLDA